MSQCGLAERVWLVGGMGQSVASSVMVVVFLVDDRYSSVRVLLSARPA